MTTLADLRSLSPDYGWVGGVSQALREGIITSTEAKSLREELASEEAAQRADYQRQCRAKEVARQAKSDEEASGQRADEAHWEKTISQEIDAALAAFDAVWANCPKTTFGSYREEHENWVAQTACFADAKRAVERVSSFPPTWRRVAQLRAACQPRAKPSPGDDGPPGPGGDFMRAGR